MIGSYFKRLARQNNMKTKHGVAYGDFRGYAVTFRDGNGTKYIDITTSFPEFADRAALQSELRFVNLLKQYNIRELRFYDERIEIVFLDILSTRKKLSNFIDYFFPLLDRYNASKINICPRCGQELGYSSGWMLLDNAAYHMHDTCMDSMKMQAEREIAAEREADGGSYLTGAIGALVGALIGAVPIATLRYFGYSEYIFGALTGLFAYLGYKIAGGKNARGKFLIVFVCSIIGILLGVFGSDAVYMMLAVKNGQLSPMTNKDIIPGIFYLLATNEEYASDCDLDIILNISLALLCMSVVFRNSRNKRKIRVLE